MFDDSKQKKYIKSKKSSDESRKATYKWVVTITIWSFFISCFMQMIQEGLMSRVNLFLACVILFSFVFIGIIFDIVGMAVTAANEVPFHSLASRKIRGAKEAVDLIRNADKVGNICNDVIGDIVGIIAGSATTAIVVMLNVFSTGNHEFLLSIGLTGLVAAVTIGGKAVGKGIALNNSNNIVFTVGKIVSFFKVKKRKPKQKKGNNND